MEYGGFFRRLCASIVDGLIVQACDLAITFLVDAAYFIHQNFSIQPLLGPNYSNVFWGVAAWKIAGYWLIAASYEICFSGSKMQATLGKRLLGMKVVDLQGERISYWRSLGRFLGKYLLSPILVIGFIMVAFTERRQGLHDKIAGTLVVLRENYEVGTPQDMRASGN